MAALVVSASTVPAFADASPHPTPSKPTAPIPAAIAKAKSGGKPVSIDELTTQTDTLVANPNGTLTSTRNLLPVRVQKNGKWASLDATLAKNSDGTFSPTATPSGLTISGGGTGPLATFTDPAGHQLSYTMPFALPTPAVTGNSALYSSVLPGVDLSVSANDQGGMSEVLIVRNAAAAANPKLKTLALATSTKGLALAADEHGGLVVADSDGKASFRAPAPLMWDSSTTSAAAPHARAMAAGVPAGSGETKASTSDGPGTGAKVDRIPVAVESGSLKLIPDPDRLTAPDNIFPLYLDPYTNPGGGPSQHYAEVQSNCAGATGYDVPQKDGEGVGYMRWGSDCGTGLERAYYQFDISNVPSNATVLSSTVTAWDTYAASWDCNAWQPVTLHTSDGIGSTTSWSNQPSTHDDTYAPVSSNVQSGSNSNSSCPNKSASFTVTSQMQQALRAGTSWTVGLFGDENQSSSNNNFLRFSTVISVATTFDVPPDAPGTPYTVPDSVNPAGAGCNNTSVGWIGATGANGITLNAPISTQMSGVNLYGRFAVWDNYLNDGTGNPLGKGNPSTGPLASGSIASAPLGFTPQDGHLYGWGIRAQDDSPAQLTGPWATSCHFYVDETPPSTPNVANNASFPRVGNGAPNPVVYAGPNQTTTFTVTGTDPLPPNTCNLLNVCQASGIDHFLWKLDGQPTAFSYDGNVSSTGTGNDPAGNPTATASINVPIANWGVHTLYVAAVDKAGNMSQAAASYTFTVPWNPTTKIVPGDIDGDHIPDLLGVTNTGDLNVIPGGGKGALPKLVSTSSQSPNGDGWKNYMVAHHGSLVGGPVDDLYAFSTQNQHMYAVLNDLQAGGTGTSGFTLKRQTDLSKPQCMPGSRCTGYNAADWSTVKQIATTADIYGGQGSDLITAESSNGTTQLWLYQGTTAPGLAYPQLLGAGDWSNMTLITPGTVSNIPTLWARDNRTGSIYTYSLKPSSTNVPPLLQAPATTTGPIKTVLKATDGRDLCLSDPSASTADGTVQISWYCGQTDGSQSWTLGTDGTIKAAGKCLEGAGGSTTHGTAVDIATCQSGNAGQQWALNGYGLLVNVKSQLCLSVPSANRNAGTQLILWDCGMTDNSQAWVSPTGLTAIGYLPSQYRLVASPGDVNSAPTSAQNGGPDGIPDLYYVDTNGQLFEYTGTGSTPAHVWPLNDGTGSTTAADGAGGLSATVGGGASWVTDKTRGMSLSLNGTTGYAATSAPAVDTSGDFTVSAWVNPSGNLTNGYTLVSQSTATDTAFQLYYSSWAHSWAFGVTSQTAGMQAVYGPGSGANSPQIGTWAKVVGIYTAATHQMQLYVNGTQVATGTLNGTAVTSGTSIQIGRHLATGAYSDYASALINDVQTFNTALPPADAANLNDVSFAFGWGNYLGNVSDTATHNWNLNEGTGTTASDRVGSLAATLNGGASWANDAARGNVLNLNGSTAYAATNAAAVDASGDFTVSAWVNPSGNLTNGYTLVSQSTATDTAFQLYYSSWAHSWAFGVTSQTAGFQAVYGPGSGANSPQIGTWAKVVGIYTAATRQIQLYVNGTQVATGTLNGAAVTSGTSIQIGRHLTAGAYNDYASTLISDIRVYNTALPPLDAMTMGDGTSFTQLS